MFLAERGIREKREKIEYFVITNNIINYKEPNPPNQGAQPDVSNRREKNRRLSIPSRHKRRELPYNGE